MAQNIYDNPTFFTTYNNLPRSQHGLSAAPEWPILQSMILQNNPNIQGSRILDLGCGYGWFCRWAIDAGASEVHGIDLSERMLDKAREMTASTTAGITYARADLDQVQLAEESYDVVYSSLTFHYLNDLQRLFNAVHGALKRKGRFVFSVEHPVYTAPEREQWYKSDGEEFWLLNGYGREGERVRDWLGENVRKYHRTTQTYISLLLRGGFTLVDFVEWMPSDRDLEEHPDWAVENNRPAFLLVAAERRESAYGSTSEALQTRTRNRGTSPVSHV